MPFVKLDCGIIHSSLWAESSDTKICWITLLLLADQNGFVRAAPSAIAREAGIPAEVARKAISLFCSPDNESRSPENQGKRIERVDGGFHILNYEKYRERDYTNAERQKRWRERNVTGVTEPLPVTPRNTSRSRVQKQKAEVHPLAPSRGKCPSLQDAVDFLGSETIGTEFFDYYESNGWRVGRNPMKDWKAAARRWKRQQATGKVPYQKPKEGRDPYEPMSDKLWQLKHGNS